MKVTIFTTAHPVDDVRVYSKFARSFLSAGFKLTWIGPHYTAFSDRDGSDSSIVYNTFGLRGGKLGRLLAIPRAALRLAGHRGADWIYCPDPDAAVIAVVLRRFHGGRIVFDVHEEYHSGLLSRWVGERSGKAVAGVLVSSLRFAARRVDILAGVNDSVLAPYEKDAKHSFVLMNSAPDWFTKDSGSDDVEVRSGLRLFHGKASETNGTPQILEALQLLTSDVEVLMFPAAAGAESRPYMNGFFELVDRFGLGERLVLSESVPHKLMPDTMDTCQVGMIGYGRELGLASLPNRLFEYMARGLAILAPVYSPLIREIVEKHDLGIVRDFENPASIADGIQWFKDNPTKAREMGERARLVFRSEYSWAADFERLRSAMSSFDNASKAC